MTVAAGIASGSHRGAPGEPGREMRGSSTTATLPPVQVCDICNEHCAWWW
jgi:hypothetical protein